MLKIRRSHDRLIFNMGIPIPGKTVSIMVPTLFPKLNSRTFQGLIKDNITFVKHYRIVIRCIANAFFCAEIHLISILTIENMDNQISSDGRFDDKITKSA